jgi:hypothetical protein
MALNTFGGQGTVSAKLLVDMVFDGKDRTTGEIVTMSKHDFNYLKGFDRVIEAPLQKAKS